MDEPAEEIERKKIKTFVFIDIEATGLPGDDPRILELCMIAVSREDLLSMNSPKQCDSADRKQNNVAPPLPRVLHKYTRLFYPWKLITPKLEEITGLSNDLLHRLPSFSQNSAEAISLFLELPRPLAIVAHNGDRYDFPLLKAELNNVQSSLEKFSYLQCVDTLKAIKDIDAFQRQIELQEIMEITEIAASFSFEDMDEDMEEAPINERGHPVETAEKRVNNASHAVCLNVPTSQAQEVNHRTLEASAELHMTPMKDISAQKNTPSTPLKLAKPLSPPVTPMSTNADTPGFNSQTLKETNKARRQLTYEGNSKRKWDGTKPYAQINIYKRLFKCEYLAHRAESDCQAMLQICGYYGNKFVNWADMFAEKFNDVKPMWSRRQAFKLS